MFGKGDPEKKLIIVNNDQALNTILNERVKDRLNYGFSESQRSLGTRTTGNDQAFNTSCLERVKDRLSVLKSNVKDRLTHEFGKSERSLGTTTTGNVHERVGYGSNNTTEHSKIYDNNGNLNLVKIVKENTSVNLEEHANKSDNLTKPSSKQPVSYGQPVQDSATSSTSSRCRSLIVLFCSAFSLFTVVGIGASMTTFFPSWLEEFQDGRSQTAVIQSLLQGLTYGFGVVTGFIINKFNVRLTMCIGAVLVTVGYLAAVFAPSTIALILTVGLLSGTGSSFVYLAGLVVVSRSCDKHASIALCVTVACTSFGAAVFPYLLDYLKDQYGWRKSFYVLAGLSIQSLWMGFVATSLADKPKEEGLALVDDTSSCGESLSVKPTKQSSVSDDASFCSGSLSAKPIGKRSTSDDSPSCGGSLRTKPTKQSSVSDDSPFFGGSLSVKPKEQSFTSDDNATSSCGGVSKLCQQHQYITICIAAFVSYGVHNGFSDILADYANIVNSDVVLYLFLIGSCNVIFNIGSSILNSCKWVNSFILLSVFLLVTGCVLILLAFTDNSIHRLVLIVLLGICKGGAVGMVTVAPLEFTGPDNYALAFGIVNTLKGVGTILVGPLYGLLYDFTRSYDTVFTTIGCVTCVLGVLPTLSFVANKLKCKQ